MGKYKMRQYETLNGDMFPQAFSNIQMVGKQKQIKTNVESLKDYGPESQQPSIDEILEWLGNPDKY